MICQFCGVDPESRRKFFDDSANEIITLSGHDCHCIRINGLRIAVGIQ